MDYNKDPAFISKISKKIVCEWSKKKEEGDKTMETLHSVIEEARKVMEELKHEIQVQTKEKTCCEDSILLYRKCIEQHETEVDIAHINKDIRKEHLHELKAIRNPPQIFRSILEDLVSTVCGVQANTNQNDKWMRVIRELNYFGSQEILKKMEIFD